jgi:hypothetical protein
MRGEQSRVSGDIEVYLVNFVKYPGLFLIPPSTKTRHVACLVKQEARKVVDQMRAQCPQYHRIHT